MGWYHWECVQVTEEPVGTWLCPSCSPNAAFYIKQLVKGQSAPPRVPNPGKVATPISSKSRKATTPTPSKGKGQEPGTSKKGVLKKGVAVKKGPAVKKPAREKPKPKWVGWIELSSSEEEDYKKKVNAKFTMEDSVQGKRTRASEVAAEESETGSHRPRTRSGPEQKINQQADADSDDEEETNEEDYVYQEKEEESEEKASGNEGASMNEDASSSEDALMYKEASLDDDALNEEESVEVDEPLSQDDEEDSMEIDEESQNEDEGSANHLSDPPLDISDDNSDASSTDLGEDGSPAPRPVESGVDEADSPSSPAASSSSDAELQPTTPVSPTSDRPLEETAAQRDQASSASPTSEDSMEVDEGHVAVTVHPAIESNNYAALYQHKGNYWGEHPESAIRSTLPRLG